MKRFFCAMLLLLSVFVPLTTLAQSEDQEVPAQALVSSEEIKTRITRIVSEYEQGELPQVIFEIEHEGETIQIDTGVSFTEGLRYRVSEGSEIYVQLVYKDGVVDQAFFVDVVRTQALFFLLIVFCILVIAVGYWRGFQAIIGLALTLLILFGFIIPRILHGADPVLTTVLGSIVILAVNMHLSHGLTRQTFMAFLATLVGLLLSVGFAEFFVWITNLSGFSSEESALLYFHSSYAQIPVGILLASIILGAVGVLDDIAITQSETVAELLDANPKLTAKDLYMRAMRVGRHHIASTVNTLVLAYAGVALPLFLLFVLTNFVSPMRFLNEEMVAEEIVRTLAGTAALILTVPVATLFAAWTQKKYPHSHKH